MFTISGALEFMAIGSKSNLKLIQSRKAFVACIFLVVSKPQIR